METSSSTIQRLRPAAGTDYARIIRSGGRAGWRSLAGIVLALVALLFLTGLLSQALIALAWATTGSGITFAEYAAQAYAFERPSGMLAANLATAALAPVCWALLVVLHRLRPGWLSSVQARIRWRYLLVCLVVAAVVLIGGQLALRPMPDWTIGAGAGAFLMIILLTTPLQAAAEEVIFRGYLLQAFGSLLPRWLAVVLAALVFALLHGSQSPAMFVDRLALGLIAGALVVRTGGLEAAIAAHVISNTFAYLSAALSTSVAAARATQQIGWGDALFDVGSFAVFSVVALLIARGSALSSRVDRQPPG
jgi:membrane protease YdiL (CAAX protease family)